MVVHFVFCINSAEMLVNLGVPWVIIGHSERRQILQETNEVQSVLLSLIYILFITSYFWSLISYIITLLRA